MKILLATLLLVSSFAQAETKLGVHLPFYLSHKGSGVGGYGIHISREFGAYDMSFDRLQDVTRNDGKIDTQHFVSASRKFRVRGLDLVGGIALGEKSTAIGSVMSFKLGVEYNFGRYSVALHHWSNAGMSKPNWAYNTLVLSRSL